MKNKRIAARAALAAALAALAWLGPVRAAGPVPYDIVYVRAPRPDAVTRQPFAEVANPVALAPASDLMLLHPDGSEEVLVAGGSGAVADPFVSFDGRSVYYAYAPDVTATGINAQRRVPYRGSDIYRIDLSTRLITRLTHQEFTPSLASGNWDVANFAGTTSGKDTLGFGVLNMSPVPVAGNRIVFASTRTGTQTASGVLQSTQLAFQLFVMNADGSSVQPIAPMTLGSALHPVPLKDGRVMFSSAETQGLRDGRLWGVWAIWPDGRHWEPLISAFDAPNALHFAAQLSNEDVVVEDYYNANNNGFGALYRFPTGGTPGQPRFGSPNPALNPAINQTVPGIQGYYPTHIAFSPNGIFSITPFTSGIDRDSAKDTTGAFVGKFTHPASAPNNDLLVVWSGRSPAHLSDTPAIDAGIYVIRDGAVANSPADLVLIKNDPKFNETEPHAVVPYTNIYGVPQPALLPFQPDDGSGFGFIGGSSLYKRDSAPGFDNGGHPGYNGLDPFNTRQNENNSNWFWQGADAGKYTNAEIYAIRILQAVPQPYFSYGPDSGAHFWNAANERLQVLGEIPVRKTATDGSPVLDSEGNPDTSWLAKVPADRPILFQTIDANGLVLNASQTWHQVRAGETHTDCGGCHAHSQAPLAFAQTAAATPAYTPADLTAATPKTVEFLRDIRPILQRSCVPCHSGANPPGNLALDDATLHAARDFRNRPEANIPGDFLRLAMDSTATFGYKPVIGSWRTNNLSRYVRAFQSRRSLLAWKVYGRRLDGWTNADHPTEATPGDATTLPAGTNLDVADLDYTGTVMPPPGSGAPALTDAEKRLFALWIDLGAPIDLGALDGHPTVGWFLTPPWQAGTPAPGPVSPSQPPAPPANVRITP